jgi:hypothetical protein
MSDNQTATRHWIISYVSSDGIFGAHSLWLDTPHELLVTKELWEKAKRLAQSHVSGSIVLSMTPRNETA